MKDKTLNKDTQLRVRLTPYLSKMLEEVSALCEVTKSALVRYILELFFKSYDNSNG